MQQQDEMPLTALVNILRGKGLEDISTSKLQYYKDLGIIRTVNAWAESKIHTYSLKEVSQRLKQIKDLKKQGKTLAEIAATINK